MTPSEIINYHAINNDVSVMQILGERRIKKLVDVRQNIAAHLKETGMSLSDIARTMNRHHSTIINLLRRGKHDT